MRELVRDGLINSVRVVRESYATTVPTTDYEEPGFTAISVPDVNILTLVPGEIVWVRGGWKSHLPWIERHLPNHWFLYYGANAGHHSWPHWDVILEDRHQRYVFPDSLGRLVWYYRKPVAPEFRARPGLERTWDVCVGASHIYDRKGQFRALDVCDEFYRLTGRQLRCIVPGCFYSREKQTERMKARLQSGAYPNVHLSGMLPREELVGVYNRSRFMYAATCGGQGDRCALEAGVCGCRMITARRRNHGPYVTADERFCFTPTAPEATGEIARYLAREIDEETPTRLDCAAYHVAHGGTEAVVAQIAPVLAVLRENPKTADRAALAELLKDPF